MKHFPKFCGKLVLRLVCCILVAVLLMTAAYRVPTGPMQDNMWSSVWTLYDEGVFSSVYPWCTSVLDTFTDSFMLLHAVYRNEEPAIIQAMNIYRPYFETKDQPYADLVEHYVNGREYINEITYERYWHGYLVYLKPMLYVTDYATIRILNGLGHGLVILLAVLLMVLKQCKRWILPYLLAIGMLNPLVSYHCLQFSSCFYAMNFGCLALLLCKDRLEQWDWRIFLYTGIFTAFLDFLTYPLVTLGIPAVLYFSLRKSRGWKEDLADLIRIGFSWGFGYAGMWSGKWVVSGIITGKSQFAGILTKLQERTVGTVYGEDVTLMKTWTETWTYFWRTPVTIAVIAVLAVLVVLVLRKLAKRQLPAAALVQALPFLLLILSPFVWYAVAQNHSYMHALLFTHKTLLILPFGALCLGVKLLTFRADEA